MTGVYSHTQVNANTTNDILNKLLHHLGNMRIVNTTVANTLNHDPFVVAFHSGSPNFAGPNIGPTYPLGFPPQAQPSTYYYYGPNNQFPSAYTMPHAHFVQPTSTGPILATRTSGQPINISGQHTSTSVKPKTKGPTTLSGQPSTLPHAFNTETLQALSSGAWNMDIGASSRLNNSVNSLSENFNTCMYPSISVGDGYSIPVTNTGHSILPTPFKSLHLNNVLITPHIVKNLISVRQFVRDNNCTIEFDAFGFSVKDFMTRRVLLRCDSTKDLYPVTAPSPIPRVFLVSQYMWHQRLGHTGREVLRHLVSNNFISCNKEKPHVLCHACQLGKHVRLPFVSSNTVVTSCFEIIHSDVWTSPIPSL
ncbi:ribonuclease H-like domain-containing protein [Tanacetum coccineum]